MGSYFSVNGVEGGLKVKGEFIKSLFGVGDRSISHSVIPGFGIGGSSSSTHLVQGGHDFGGIRGVKCQV